jgi:hypothetical protein
VLPTQRLKEEAGLQPFTWQKTAKDRQSESTLLLANYKRKLTTIL